jgi:hypothetical protein
MLKELSTKDKKRVGKIIESTNGKFFQVTFTKRTSGKLRTMNCRTGVTKFVKGEEGKGTKYNPEDKDIIWVWDLNAYVPKGDTGYRSINLRTVKEIRFAGQVHTFG